MVASALRLVPRIRMSTRWREVTMMGRWRGKG